MTSKTWKSAERTVARLLGGERVPITGRARGSAPDVAHDVLSIEVKHWKKFPDWLKDAMNQAEESQKNGQIPAVILHEKGMKYEDCYTVIRLSDVIKLLDHRKYY